MLANWRNLWRSLAVAVLGPPRGRIARHLPGVVTEGHLPRYADLVPINSEEASS